MMKINPEIRKYIWLEISIQRLLMIPLVLGIIFYTLSEIGKAKTFEGYNQSLLESFEIIYLAFVIVWGAYRSYSSFKDEERYKTWDFQRLSSLTPEKIILGKIFGSTILCWYIALFCLPLIFTFSYNLYGIDKAVTEVITYILLTIIAFLLGFSYGITGSNKIITFISLPCFLGLYFIPYGSFSKYTWYGIKYDYEYFFIWLCLIILLWLFLFTYVKVRKILKMNTSQISWLIFLIFILFLFMGFCLQEKVVAILTTI